MAKVLVCTKSLPFEVDYMEYEPFYLYEDENGDPVALTDETDLSTLRHATKGVAAKYDWSGVAIDNDANVRRKNLGGLITPEHLAVAKHNVTLGERKFLSQDNVLYTRSFTKRTDILDTDLSIIWLSDPLPSTCRVYPIIRNIKDIDGAGLFAVEQSGDVILVRFFAYFQLTHDMPLTAVNSNMSWQRRMPTASGNPVFAALNSTLYLTKANGSASSGVSIAYYENEINEVIAPYTLNMVDIPKLSTRVINKAQLATKVIPCLN